GDRRVDVLDDDRAAPVHVEPAELVDHAVGLGGDDVELERVAVRIAGDAFEDDQVHHAVVRGQRLQESRRDVAGADGADVDQDLDLAGLFRPSSQVPARGSGAPVE